MIGPRTCAYGRPYVDPAFTSQSYDIIISISTRRTNLSICLVVMLMVMHGLVKTRLKEAVHRSYPVFTPFDPPACITLVKRKWG